MSIVSRFVVPGIIYILTLASGVWLTRSGKPLNTAIFTIHKLIALGAAVAATIQTYQVLKTAQTPAILIALLVVAGVCVLALFATGALLSVDRPAYRILLTVHNIAPVLAVIVMALAVYLLSART